jgi:hypothetical protein
MKTFFLNFQCDKLKKKRSSLMGAFVSTHGRSIDDVDKAILEARFVSSDLKHYKLKIQVHSKYSRCALQNCID